MGHEGPVVLEELADKFDILEADLWVLKEHLFRVFQGARGHHHSQRRHHLLEALVVPEARRCKWMVEKVDGSEHSHLKVEVDVF